MEQTNIALSYHRRLSALNGIMKSTLQAKSMLKNKYELLQKENKDLFGKEIREQISETIERLTNIRKSCCQVLFLKTVQVETSPFGKAHPRQANNIVRRAKILQKQQQAKKTVTPTGIISTVV